MTGLQPLIFVSNDDGYAAKGINELIAMLRPLGELFVVAPDGPRSGAACSITSVMPVRVRKMHAEAGLTVYACTGTPVDCVKLGLEKLLGGRRPDLIVTGINHGDNSSVNIHYSGTMGAAMEGCMKDIPAVGFSLCSFDADADFTPCTRIVRQVVAHVLRKGLPHFVCLSVNFPALPAVQGLKVCRMAHGTWQKELEQREHPHGGAYYWLTGAYLNLEPEAEDTDQWALAHGYASLTPVRVDMTDGETLRELKTLEGL